MRNLPLLTLICLFLTVSLAEAQRTGSRSAQSRIVTAPSQYPVNNNSSNNTNSVAKSSPALDALTHPRNHVLLIGVNDYPKAVPSTETMLSIELSKLNFCRKDMEGLQDALVKARFCKAEDIQVLVSGGTIEPTEANVRKALREMLSKVQRGDRVLIAFSGHGVAFPLKKDEPPKGFICCADIKVLYNTTTRNFDSMQGLIDREWIESELDKSGAEIKLFFVDACRENLGDWDSIAKNTNGGNDIAGARSPVTTFGVDSIDAKGYSVSAVNSPKLYRFSSGMPGTISWEREALGHGVFTYFLIKGMLGEAQQLTAPGKITLDDLSQYVRRETEKYVATIPNASSQTPIGTAFPPDSWHPDKVVFSYPYDPKLHQRLQEEERTRQLAEQQQREKAEQELQRQKEREQQARTREEQQQLQRERLAQQQAERQEQERLQREQLAQQREEQQRELRRQQEIVAQRYKEEFGNFAQTSTSRLQEIDNEQFRQSQQVARNDIANRINSFNNTKPQSEQSVNTWNQTGQRLQRDIDAWMTRTNPVVVASSRTHLTFNQSESAGARRAAGYNTTGGSGNRNGGGR